MQSSLPTQSDCSSFFDIQKVLGSAGGFFVGDQIALAQDMDGKIVIYEFNPAWPARGKNQGRWPP